MSACLCDCLSAAWVQLMNSTRRAETHSMDLILDGLSSRQINLEIQDRRCLCEARRFHASGSRTLFRSKMLEHRRLHSQLLQLQRCRDNLMVQIDAAKNHEINQSIVNAIRGASALHRSRSTMQDAESALEDAQESMAHVRELSEFLGQPLTADANDDDLEEEFLELSRPTRAAADDGAVPAAVNRIQRAAEADEGARLLSPLLLAAASG